jgi:hypothetical protein
MKTLMMIAAVVALATLPTFVIAAPDSAGNVAAGAAVDAAGSIGRPAGAAVGPRTVGAGSREARDRDVGVVIEQRRVPARQQSCAQDALGNSMCEDIRR